MKYYHRGWHRIADELEAELRSGSHVCEHWFFMRDPRVAEIAARVSRTRLKTPEPLPSDAASVRELFQAALLDPARLFDEKFETANQFLDFHLALILEEAKGLGLEAIKPILPDAAGMQERVHALGDAFDRFKAAKAHALVKREVAEPSGVSNCAFEI